MIQRRSYLKPGQPPKRKTWLKRGTKPIPQVNVAAKARRVKGYRKVLSSRHWKALRLKVWSRMWKRDDSGIVRRCEACGAPLYELSEMQLAHLTYARFGKELDDDVQGQCKQCNQTEAALRGKRIRRTA